ncbi:B3 domain-containing protein REM9-like [Papaver somniferum]|nr:B3 domain-containing protein REM9-like [Papaver somniferum]
MESSKLVEPVDDRKHHFFKILQGEVQNRMRIPEAICSRLPTDSPRCGLAVVEGPNGASLIVEVSKTQDGTYLEEGWEIFVQENGLKKLDILDFRHDGGMQFHVKVFEGNECPREECFAPVPSPVPAQESHGLREECFTPVPSPLERERKRQGSPCESSNLKKRDSFNHEKFASAIEVESKVKSFSSPFPFFWTSVKLSDVCRMSIPAKFAREHLQTNMKGREEKMDVLLQNEEGGTWELRVCSYVTQNYFIKGWKMFATDNKLKIGDFVIFELIDKRPDAKFVMNFHIYRNYDGHPLLCTYRVE